MKTVFLGLRKTKQNLVDGIRWVLWVFLIVLVFVLMLFDPFSPDYNSLRVTQHANAYGDTIWVVEKYSDPSFTFHTWGMGFEPSPYWHKEGKSFASRWEADSVVVAQQKRELNAEKSEYKRLE